MICIKCKKEIEEESKYCRFCGRKQERSSKSARRINGTGTVVLRPNGKYRATVTLGYYIDPDKKDGTVPRKKRKTVSKDFATKKEAMLALPSLSSVGKNDKARDISFKELYDLWLPTHRAGASTLGNYKAAIKYFDSLFFMKMSEIEIEDLQDCLDACPRTKRTRENMKACCGLMYKYGIPRNYIPKDRNLADFLIVEGESGKHRESFTQDQIELIRKQIGKTFGADYIYCLIYLGFRPTEFVTLQKENYDVKNQVIVAGIKTDAGKNRSVTVSPKIQPYMKAIYEKADKFLIVNPNGYAYDKDNFPELMYSVLDAAGIDNPMIESAGRQVHKYTPHSCRHTFATLMKRVQADAKDKKELIGHASEEMLRYYQDVSIEDLRKITDNI